jgi:heme A synthase
MHCLQNYKNNMRILFISSLVFVAAVFLTPHIVSAQTCSPACTGGQSCVNDDFGNGICVGGGGQAGGGSQVQAGGGNPNNSGTQLLNPLKGGQSLQSFLTSILSFVIKIGAIVVVFMLVYVGYLFVVAQGAPDKISKARTALLWTIVGALILLGAQAIALGIQATVDALSTGQ